jgi:aminoglycoside phosphotransferase (APT) family kinase protein
VERETVEVTCELVAALIGQQFPQWSAQVVERVTPGGWDNHTFRLGDSLLVRLPSAQRYVAQVQKEHRWLPVLAKELPLPIPVPLALGQPGLGYEWPWSVYRWLQGEPATSTNVASMDELAIDLASFLRALQRIDATDGPPPGEHNFFRGGSLATYDQQTRAAVAALEGELDSAALLRIWESALDATCSGLISFMHGDIAASNLLVHGGRLAAVIDFGSMGVGDVACDLTIAWTFFTGSARQSFLSGVTTDESTWRRAQGWALWKALILLAWRHGPQEAVADARRVLGEVLAG